MRDIGGGRARTIRVLLLIAAFATATTGAWAQYGSKKLGSDGKPANFKYGKLKIQALGGAACGAPAYVAFEKGYLADEGFDAELVEGTFETEKTGLVTGEFTVTNGDFQWFTSIQSGLDLKVIGGLHKGCLKLLVPADSPIKTGADLKGKNIGVDEIGGTPMSITTLVLANANVDPQKDVTWKIYADDLFDEAVKKGEIDAFATWDPFGATYIRDKGYRALTDISTDPIFKGRSCCFLYASGKKIKENPARVAAIARAYQRADEYIAKHPEETARLEIDYGYVATKDLQLIENLIDSYDYAYTNEAVRDDVEYFTAQFKKTGFLKKSTDPAAFTQQVYWNAFAKP
jgi:NitT/TauT family transport system substrate-binding protein